MCIRDSLLLGAFYHGLAVGLGLGALLRGGGGHGVTFLLRLRFQTVSVLSLIHISTIR